MDLERNDVYFCQLLHNGEEKKIPSRNFIFEILIQTRQKFATQAFILHFKFVDMRS